MLQSDILPRAFYFKQGGEETRLADPNTDWTAEQVMGFYSGTYPILTNAKIEGPEIKGDEVRYSFMTTLGTKG
ncbi:hypothetical protein SRABI27_03701 [Pedobacter sp. Bi27]|uniref:PRTRC system protein C n=1 Tax=Pedobacter sp. Bi27 TaxID=2822351 RepID=UPI001E1677BB|nr:PRTRC system protein C [Pedobacter sp. Bi27]CAH0278394.1 hypothetical protein SRABI27_03701 [Pedobacter sp. Bi27]